MTRFVEYLGFDTKLFKFSVGRIDLKEWEIQLLLKFPTIHDILRQAYTSGYRLIYIFAPPVMVGQECVTTPNSVPNMTFPGIVVDNKTTYHAKLEQFNKEDLVNRAFTQKQIQIKRYSKTDEVSFNLKNLAIASGSSSRFKIDEGIPNEAFEAMFIAWITNSVKKTAADEIFVCYDINSKEEIGFVTVKDCHDNTVNIGLLAVSSAHRRMGIASALLSRAVLWAFEEIGSNPDSSIHVVTQGNNVGACKCYEQFGFQLKSTQLVYHCWLPDHLQEHVSVSDQAPLPFCKQHFTGNENKYIQQVLTTGLDSASHFTLMCSAKLQDLLGSESTRVLMVPSGTAALEMAALLCNLSTGDEVIMPSFTFSSTANAFVLRGAVPVFVDVEINTLNIDISLIENAITSKTKAICVVHYGGVPCDMDVICAVAKKHQLYLIEDAAQGFLSTYKGKQLGTFGNFGCFSFHYTKNIMCGEGGALSVNRSDENARRALVMWEKGTNRYDFISGKIDKYEWIDVGSSYVPSEVSCAILWAQLEQSDAITSSRVNHFHLYSNTLQPLVQKGFFTIPILPADCQTNAHIFFIILPSVERKKIYATELKKRGISAFSHYVPLHSAPAGVKFGRAGSIMTVTDKIHHTLLRLPVWKDMTDQDVLNVVYALESISFGLSSDV